MTKEKLWQRVIANSERCGPCHNKLNCLQYVTAKRYMNGDDINKVREIINMKCKEDKIIQTVENKEW